MIFRMGDLQAAKQLVWDYWHSLPSVDLSAVHPHAHQHASHPLNDLYGADDIREKLWTPLLRAVPDLTRQTDMFFAGHFQERTWVTGIGYLRGTFRENWLGIPATGGEIAIRFGEFCMVEQGKIVNSQTIFDMVDVMRQAGYEVLAPSRGREGIVPGPMTSDGVLRDPQPADVGETTLALTEAMLNALGRYDQKSLASMGMKDYWTPDMRWYGPSGIGACHSLKEFEDFHQRPFLESFPDRRGTGHLTRFAEGDYSASTGWNHLWATFTREYLGVAPTHTPITMRVMDHWRRAGDLLAENWVLIDLPNLFMQVGVDLFDRLHK